MQLPWRVSLNSGRYYAARQAGCFAHLRCVGGGPDAASRSPVMLLSLEDRCLFRRRGLGNRFAGLFDRMPPHTPRRAAIEAAAAAREVGADVIVTIGGGSVTDGAKAVQLCLANDIRTAEALDQYRPVKGPDGAVGPPPCGPAGCPANHGADHLVGWRVQRELPG